MKTVDAVVLYMAHLIEEEMANGKKLRPLGKEWNLHHSTLATLRFNLRGGGKHVETKIAEAVTGGSVDELRRLAKVWHAKHPGWRPKDYASPDAPPKNSAFAWWDEEAARFAASKPKLAWAVAAAAEKPQSDEPRADRRRAYVERAVDSLLDLPEKTVAALERRYGSKGR
jgi:hypothetical protein